MPVDWSEVVLLLSTLTEQAHMQVAIRETAKGTVIAASCTALAGILAGPVGLALGGAVGGAAAAWYCSGRYKPLPQIISEMDGEQKRALVKRALLVLHSVDYSDIESIKAAVESDDAVREQLLQAVTQHVEAALRTQVHRSITD